MKCTFVVIVIIIGIAIIHLYKIKSYEHFQDVAIEGNQIISESSEIIIPSMEQLSFNGFSLKSIMDDKASKIELNNAMPELSVIAYAGALAPTGWQLCNGSALKYTNNSFVNTTDIRINNFRRNDTGDLVLTPNLQGRFILGNGSDGLDRVLYHSAGEANVTLTEAQMPSHNHNFTGMGSGNTWLSEYSRDGTYGSEKDSKLVTTNNTGGGQAHNNMPPYYVLTYIIKQLSPPS